MNTAPITPQPGDLDAKGTPFDPARHLPKQNKHTGCWMPRGGRKPKPPTPPTSDGPGTHHVPDVTPQTHADTPLAEPNFDDIEKAAGPATPPPSAEGEAKPVAAEVVEGDAKLSPESTGELCARAIYTATGALIGDHKAATASGAEHANIRAVIAAYCRARGWAVVGILAVIGTGLAYLLGDNRREIVAEKLKSLFGSQAKPAQPVAAPVTRANAPEPEQRAEGLPERPPAILPTR